MGHMDSSSTDNGAESNMDYGNPDQELSEENNISTWARDNSCDNVEKVWPLS